MSNKNEISINLPSLDQQRFFILKSDTEQAISMLKKNLDGKPFPKVENINYSTIDQRIFCTIEQGWVAPPSELIDAWFTQVKNNFIEYGTDGKLGSLLGLQGRSADRRIRAYRNGAEIIPYGVWRTFLELTGRVVVDVKPVLGVFDCE
ncbi:MULTISPECIES: hypothetical protein [Enterobacteriaceae]|uniref:hypothetical protein n=1 Tax=Enterobacteriaceae TaxID=543 RepID=UPI000D6E7AE7|nr:MULTISPECIES: hypothetical protein [Enterobacteriaceae]ELK8463435.1 hypothetical protein [Salmonella enterica]MCS8554251.1 hypothetical protein [Citrobacter sp. XY323]HBB0306605.1 hypothetical protein [Escherichia coli]HCL5404335.1 hypothetical protein [Citrobacter freundii]HED3098992.1 hypothetical protein [Citrobacter freundii]